MERLTKRGIKQEGMIWFVDHENNDMPLEPCEMNSHHNRVVLEKLADYEDKQEQGLLIELPCGIGADVYSIPSRENYDLNVLAGIKKFNRVYHQKVKSITFGKNGWYLECDKDVEFGTGKLLLSSSYKVTWFLTEAEAEEALARMKGE